MTTLFAIAGLESGVRRPLADRLRPKLLAEIVGQDHLVGTEGSLTRLLASGGLGSLILWGPPGTGKTTLGRLLAREADLHFEPLSAVQAGTADLKRAFDTAKLRGATGRGTLLFVDEVHRFNRAQQDQLLPVVEDGTVVLVGATTENPSFALNAALLSRARVLNLKPLTPVALETLLARAEDKEGRPLPLGPKARALLLRLADGDGRAVLTYAEEVWRAARPGETLDAEALGALLQRRAPAYDRAGDGHYGLISALHKAVRGSDPDAALYWLARMIEGGEDPLFLARRLVRMASEDIGLADPTALPAALAARDAYAQLGAPEGELALAQCVLHLACAPKSNAAYTAWKAAQAAAREHGSLPPRQHSLNAPTKLMKAQGFGEGYAYDHDAPGGFAGQDHFPAGMARRAFYAPAGRGAEAAIGERLAGWAKARRASGKEEGRSAP